MEGRTISKNILRYSRRFKNKLIFESLSIGILSGLIVVFYRLLIDNVGIIRDKTIGQISFGFWMLITIIFAFIINYMNKKQPLISGSGIPQIRAIILRQISYNPLKVLLYKFVGGILAIFNGLSLGREGPSIQIGATAGMYISNKLGRNKLEEKYLITAGASAGLAAAFNAPLAGVVFALEELHRNFSPLVLLTSMISAVTADFISKFIFGLKPVFNFETNVIIPLRYYFLLMIFGVLLGFSGTIFNKLLIYFLNLFSKIKFNKVIIPTTIAWVLIKFYPQVLGGGHNLIESLVHTNIAIKVLLILFVLKLFYTSISYGSGAPGGIFLPMLVLGAIMGSLFYKVTNLFVAYENNYLVNFIILGMTGYFTAVVRAPITGIILITELTGSFNHLLSLSLISLISYLTAGALGESPVYETLLERLLAKHNPKQKSNLIKGDKTIIEIPVITGSILDGIKIKDYKWPEHSLIISIKRGELEIIPKGNTTLLPGDIVVILTEEEKASEYKLSLMKTITS